MNGQSLKLWLLCLLFFSSGLFHVRARIARTVGKNPGQATFQTLAYHLLLAALLTVAVLLWKSFSYWVALAFAPILARAFWPFFTEPSQRLNLKRIGYLEVVQTVIFVITCGLALRLA